MCLDCGCVLDGTGTPDDDHGIEAHIVIDDLALGANATGISLDQAAANITATLAAIDNSATLEDTIAKAASEQRYVLGVAYQPGRDDRIAKGVDGGRDFFTDAELEKAAWQFLQEAPEVGIYHVDGAVGAAQVVESYIYRGPDWDLGDGVVVRKGYWLVGAILDEPAWQLYNAGKINGFSPQGIARRRRIVRAA